MENDIRHLRQKAEQCRRLAGDILIEYDVTKIRLEALAEELSAEADELEYQRQKRSEETRARACPHIRHTPPDD